MVKSHTRKKFDKKKRSPEVLPEIRAVTDYLKQWTSRELAKIQVEENYPVCIPVSDGYRIGLYHIIINPNRSADLLDHNSEFVHRFEDKVSAILYTIYLIKKKYYKSDEILILSKEINKTYMDAQHLQKTITTANKNKEYVVVDTAQAKLEIAQNRLQIARKKLSIIHRDAKLAKVWE